MSIKISAESTVDLTPELLKEFDISTTPYTIVVGERVGFDGVITPTEIFEYYATTGKLAKTSAVNEAQFDEYFGSLLKDHEYVIHFSLCSDMSTSYSSALLSAAKFDGKVKVIDSRSLSTAIGLLAIYASRLARKGLSVDEVVKKVMARIGANQASFVLEKVNFLYKGGRCSTIAYLGANLFGIKPQIVVRNGKCVSGEKFRGKFDKVCEKYVTATLEEFDNPDLEMVFLTYTTCDETILSQIKRTLEVRGFKNIYVTQAAGTVACHCGEHCLGILYFTDGPHEEDYK